MPNDQDIKPPETADEWMALAQLLPSSRSLSESESTGSASSLWTDEELARARRGSIALHIRAGWKYITGWLTKGNAKARPSEVNPVPQPWERGYNPLKHSVAVRMGGVLVRPGLYRMDWSGIYVNENGQVTSRGNIDGVCLGCGTARNERGEIVGGDYRWQVRAPNPNPFALPHIQAWTYCRDCVTPDDREIHKRYMASTG